MARRVIDIDGERWEVAPSGRVTQYNRDEFGVVFTKGTGAHREQRVTRYSPLGSRQPEDSFNELTERDLQDMWKRSQPSWTAPETGYRR